MRQLVGSIALAAVILLLPACPPAHSGADAGSLACSENFDCPVGQVCSTGKLCEQTEPVTISVAGGPQLPRAVAQVAYTRGRLEVTGGKLPFVFSLTEAPATLSWLRLDRSAGTFSGTPPTALSSKAVFQVSVTDESRQEATRSFELEVVACQDGDTVSCFSSGGGDSCLTGTATCSDGGVASCSVAAPSTTPSACGPGCAPCGASGDACTAGQCTCAGLQACPSGTSCCGAGCIDIQTDPDNCGSCGHVCPSGPNSQGRCVQGQCSTGSTTCTGAFGNCDGNPANGCETNLGNTIDDCGLCGNACNTPGDAPVADACNGGQCRCAGGSACIGTDCCPATAGLDAGCSDPTTGDRVDGGIARCGGCGAVFCSDPQGPGRATCGTNGGGCGAECLKTAAGHQTADCAHPGGSPSTCFQDLANDVSNCGSCGNPCTIATPPATGSPVCTPQPDGLGQCGVSCNSGYCQPSQGTTNRCLAESDPGSCGSSCAVCPSFVGPNMHAAAGAVCCQGRDGNNSCISTCNQGFPASCSCGVQCFTGFGDCRNGLADGCETDLSSDVSNCGGCGTACGGKPNAVGYACNSSECSITACAAGYANCDTATSFPNGYNTGCETNLLNDLRNCGACGNNCMTAQVTGASCASGQCAVTSCAAGHANCDGNAANGCEISLEGDTNNCGSCGHQCQAGNSCSGGDCWYRCGTVSNNVQCQEGQACLFDSIDHVYSCG